MEFIEGETSISIATRRLLAPTIACNCSGGCCVDMLISTWWFIVI